MLSILGIPEIMFYPGLIVLLTLVGTALSRLSFFQDVHIPNANTRFAELDGLRGILALSVFAHHCAYFSQYFSGQGWYLPNQSIMFMVGSVAVSMFFMITGFLFWLKVIEADGKIDIKQLFRSRFWRIYPMFIFAFALLGLIVCFRSHWTLNESPLYILTKGTTWLFCGILGFPVLNRIDPWQLSNGGVQWSLQWESWFYLLLPLLGVVLWPFKRFLFFVLLLIISVPFFSKLVNYPNIAAFLLGALAAYAVKFMPPMALNAAAMKRLNFALIVNVLLLGIAAYYAPSASWRFLAFPAFLAILYGASGFGFLNTSAWKTLGASSYSIYLLHGSILYMLFSLVVRDDQLAHDWYGIAIIAVCAVLVPVVSGTTFRLIEVRFMGGALNSRRKHRLAVRQQA